MSSSSSSAFSTVVKPLALLTLYLGFKWMLSQHFGVEEKKKTELPLPQFPSPAFDSVRTEGHFPKIYLPKSNPNERKPTPLHVATESVDGKRALRTANFADRNHFISQILLTAIQKMEKDGQSSSSETAEQNQ